MALQEMEEAGRGGDTLPVTVFRLEGAGCLDCVSEVEEAIARLPGVATADLNPIARRLTVTGQADLPAIQKIAGTEGWEVLPLTTAAAEPVTVFQLGGAGCLDCVDEVEEAIAALPGVREADLNPVAGRLTVVGAADLEAIRKIAGTEGWEVFPVQGAAAAGAATPRAPKPWWRQTRQVLLALSAVLTIIGFAIEQLGSERAAIGVFVAAIVAGIYIPARSAWASLRRRSLTINTLLVAGALGAAYLGLWEEAASLVVIFSLGEVMEIYATDRARRTLKDLLDLTPPEALVLQGGVERLVPVETIKPGDVIRIKPGSRVPLDGLVVSGESAIDESPITGESIPVDKRAGDTAYAGTLNQQGTLAIQVTVPADETTLAQIIRTVEEARAHKSSYEHFGERFSAVYTPAMFALAILVAAVPPLIFAQPFEPWFYRALVVLVISCSCGIVLSVPTATLAAISNGARRGLIVKGGAYLEIADRVDTIAFDKTGTLTTGRPVVSDIVPLAAVTEREVLQIAASVEHDSEHPLATAIVARAELDGIELLPVERFQALTGLGVTAEITDQRVWIGSPRLAMEYHLAASQLEAVRSLEERGRTVVVVWRPGEVIGLIGIQDPLRAEAREALAQLRERGVPRLVMLTGDNRRAAESIAGEAGIDEVYAELLPEDKIRIIQEIQAQGHTVGMVGDGINDGPALAQADIGIAMGARGVDVARETSDIVLMDDDLRRLVDVLALGNRATRTIRQNVYASLALVTVLVPAALLGLVDLVPGILINEGSALIVIANGLRLLRWREQQSGLPTPTRPLLEAS